MVLRALLNAQAEIGPVGKHGHNAGQGYDYRKLDDVVAACSAALKKHRVLCVPEVFDLVREERPGKSGGVMIITLLKVHHRFWAEDGSCQTVTTPGEGMDYGDKSTNKAMSGAYKNALCELFAIPVIGDDSEADNPAPAPKARAAEAGRAGGSYVTKIEEREGTSKTGKPYVLYQIWIDDVEHRTFDGGLAAKAQQYLDAGVAVTYEAVQTQWGHDLKFISAAESAPAGNDQSAPARNVESARADNRPDGPDPDAPVTHIEASIMGVRATVQSWKGGKRTVYVVETSMGTFGCLDDKLAADLKKCVGRTENVDSGGQGEPTEAPVNWTMGVVPYLNGQVIISIEEVPF
jgi:hypothetical protein